MSERPHLAPEHLGLVGLTCSSMLMVLAEDCPPLHGVVTEIIGKSRAELTKEDLLAIMTIIYTAVGGWRERFPEDSKELARLFASMERQATKDLLKSWLDESEQQ